jgi:uncharacterized OB-fold protein
MRAAPRLVTISKMTLAQVGPDQLQPPRPLRDELTSPFWEGCLEHRLMIQRCQNCHHFIHWPRPVCRFCLSTDLAPEQVTGRATLYSWTVVNQAFHAYYAARVPYLLATVELADQPRLMFFTRLTDCKEEDLRIGKLMDVVFEDAAPDLTFALYRPAA